MNINKYNINLDVNADNTAGIDISYIKIVKIDYDGNTEWGYNDIPISQEVMTNPCAENTMVQKQ